MDSENIKNIKKILVGVDDSEDAQLAFRVAMRRAIELDATLVITSILEKDEMNIYQAMSRDYIHGEEIVKHIIPAVEPDLLIIGALSKTGIRKYFGSQAAYIVKYSPISVLVVR